MRSNVVPPYLRVAPYLKLPGYKPAALVLGIAALSSALPAAANQLEEIYVEGKSIEATIPLDLAQYGNRVEVLEFEEIQRKGFAEVSQALQMLVPGLHVRPKNGPFDYVDLSLQGSRKEEILWLVDGVRINNRLYNGTSPLDTLPAHMIERIEVLKGGQGIFYGTQSVGGVVNIVTKELQNETDGSISLGMHSQDGHSANAYYRSAVGAHQFVLYGSQDKADGFKPFRDSDFQPSATDRDRGYEVNVLGLKYGLEVNEATLLSLQYQRSESDLDFARPVLNAHTVNARTEDIFTAKLDYLPSDALGLFFKAYYHNWDTRYTRIYNALDNNGNLTGGLNVVNDRDFWGYEDYGFNAMAKLNLHSGFEYVLGLDHQSYSGEDDVWRIADQKEQVNAVFAQVRTTPELWERTALAVGVRHNMPDNVQDSTVWNLSGRHQLDDNWYVQASLGTSFRLPDAEALFLNEIYDANNDGVPDDFFSVGNPDLEAEKSRNYNLGIGANFAYFSFELIGFKREITNYIASYVPVFIAGIEGESFVNSDDEVKVEGGELILGLSLGTDWGMQLSHGENRSELNNNGVQLTGIPKSETKWNLDYQPVAWPAGASLTAIYVGEFNARPGVARGDYALLDLSGYYEFGVDRQHQLRLRIENLTDEEYATRVDVARADTGSNFFYENLGMSRTLHLNYSYRF